MKIDPAPRDIGRIIDDALVLYRANFRSLVLGSLAILFPVLLLASVAGSAYYASFFSWIAADMTSALDPTTGYAQPPAAFGGMLIMQMLVYVTVPLRFIATVWLASSVFRSTPSWMAERKQSVKDFLASGRHRALHLGVAHLAVGVVSQLVILAGGLVVFTLVVVVLTVSAAGGVVGIILGAMIAIVAFLAAAVAYLWVMGRFQPWGPALVIEEAEIGRGLSRSFMMTKGPLAWRTAWFWMGVGMVSYALRTAIYAPALFLFFNSILPFVQEAGAAEASIPMWVTVLLGVSAAVAESLVIPFERACWAQYYLDLRSRVEGMDLVVRARELATAAR